MVKPLHIPPSKKWKGLTVFCHRCNTNVSDICKETGSALERCPFGDKHAFKVYVHVPGTKNERRTKKLDTRDLNEAIKKAIDFEKEVKGNNQVYSPVIQADKPKETITKPYFFSHLLSRYIGFLHNENVAEFRQKTRSKEYIKEIERSLLELAQGLKRNGYNLALVGIDELSEEIAGKAYKYLKDKKFSPRTFNKHLKHYTAWINWVKEEYGYAIRNHFETINRKTTSTDPQTITQEEYEKLLEKITFQNGIQKYSTQKKLQRNFFRPWLADGIRLGLETGRRREEVSRLKFNDIIYDKKDGTPLHIKVEDFKVNRIQSRTEDQEKKYNAVPITDSLMELLNRLRYAELKGTNKYILAPEEDIDRVKGMPDALSRGFTHYYKQLKTDRELTFKSLRKTYITNLEIFMGGNAKAIVGHSGDKVLHDHYLNKEAVARVAKGFQIFSSEAHRKEELENIRTSAKEKTKEQTLAK